MNGSASYFDGDGELARLMREMDWSRTSLGRPESWPQSLHVVVQVLLSSRYAMWLGWGEDLTLIYNDAYRALVMGAKHPGALGQPAQAVWPETWTELSPRIRQVLESGAATLDERRLRFSEHDGHLEETYHTFCYTRISDGDGNVGGSLCLVTDDTDQVLASRRLTLLRSLSERLAGCADLDGLRCALAAALADDPPDVPFTLSYLFDDAGGVRLVSRTGLGGDHPADGVTTLNELRAVWPGFSADLETPLVVSPLPYPGSWRESRWGLPATEALVFPVHAHARRPAGVFICGLNPFRRSDERAYRDFLNVCAGLVGGVLVRCAAESGVLVPRRRAHTEPSVRSRSAGDRSLPAPRPAAGDTWTVLLVGRAGEPRDRLEQLLSQRWAVRTAPDVDAALVSIEAAGADDSQRPGLLVVDEAALDSDGAAPLRAHPKLAQTPILVLMSRAPADAGGGPDAVGLNDYVVSPCAPRDLIAHVEVHHLRALCAARDAAPADRSAELLAAAPLAVATLEGPEHVVRAANVSFVDLLGARGAVGRPLRQAVQLSDAHGMFAACDEVYRSGQARIERAVPVTVGRGQRHERLFLDWCCQPIRGRDGSVEGVGLFVEDATPLVAARRAADAARRTKEEFLARIGHEFRNPLAPILTALELMTLRGIVGGERERTIIARQVKHLTGLVDDLLDVSRIARGHFRIVRAPVELADVVARGVEIASPLIDQHRHRLLVTVPAGLAVDGDRARLAQVVSQLLTNAAKYTEPGGRIEIEGREDGHTVLLTVRDTGCGIAPEMLPRVFDLFSQEEQPIDRAAGGLGLGLAIVKSIVAMHGGSVAAASEGLGRGAAFTLRLPVARAAVADSPDTRPRGAGLDGRGLLVLVVDDNIDAAQMLAESLIAHGCDVRVAHDGPAAMQLASRLRPDAAILDLGLPVMDGFEVARRFRSEPGLRETVLIALTGYGRDEDRERALAAGFAEHLVKPIDLDRLREILSALTRH